MTVETVPYTMHGHGTERHDVHDAIPVAPGLVVFRIPDEIARTNPARWRIGHHSGRGIAESLVRELALAAAEKIAKLYDWTLDDATLRKQIDPLDFYRNLSDGCFSLGTYADDAHQNAARNGIYTDADIEQAAREAKADGLNALQILNDMAHTVPWSGLDTDDFNEAHNRIAELADAD